MSRPIEARCMGHARLSNGGRVLNFHFGKDDAAVADLIEKGRRYALAIVPIGDDETQHPQLEENQKSTANGEPAPGGVSERALSEEMNDAEQDYRKLIANKYNSLCHMRRNDPQFRGFMFDYFKTSPIREPVAAREWVKQKQHGLFRVDHCNHIYPGTYAEQMFKWLESAFEADKRNLPIPIAPEEETNEKST